MVPLFEGIRSLCWRVYGQHFGGYMVSMLDGIIVKMLEGIWSLSLSLSVGGYMVTLLEGIWSLIWRVGGHHVGVKMVTLLEGRQSL